MKFLPPPEIRPLLLGVVDKARAWDDLVHIVNRWQQQQSDHPQSLRLPWAVMLERLSPREQRVFEAIGQGLNNKEIAKLLGLSIRTVETYRKGVSSKLALSGAELIRAAALHRCTAMKDDLNNHGEA